MNFVNVVSNDQFGPASVPNPHDVPPEFPPVIS
jgi:hypothetical protein